MGRGTMHYAKGGTSWKQAEVNNIQNKWLSRPSLPGAVVIGNGEGSQAASPKLEGDNTSMLQNKERTPASAPPKGEVNSDSAGNLPTFADLFKKEAKDDFKLKYFKPTSEERRRVDIPINAIENGSKEWESTLLGYFLGKKLPYSLVRNATSRFWGKQRLNDLLATENGYFFFKFNSREESEAALEGGPWHITGQPIILKKWTPGLKLQKDA